MPETVKSGWGTALHWVGEARSLFLDLLYPPLCRSCGGALPEHDGRNFCDRCWNGMAPIQDPVCYFCGCTTEDLLPEGKRCRRCSSEKYHFDRAAAIVHYEGVMREAIHWFKYRYKRRLAESLGQLLLEGLRDKYYAERFDAILPVPLHWRRRRMREFNQAQLLAEPLAAKYRVPLLEQVLIRCRHTHPQMSIRSHSHRRRNIEGAFRVKDPTAVAGKNLLLVDDLFTSGSTANECARVLKSAGAERVLVLTLARAG